MLLALVAVESGGLLGVIVWRDISATVSFGVFGFGATP
jgi:hypothetical protein